MRFGPMPLAQAAGAILAHSHETPGGLLRKGHVLTPADLSALAQAGAAEVTVAALDPGDVAEDAAAVRLAGALVPDPEAAGLDLTPPVNGRVNLRATRFGILGIDAERVLALNRIDPAITLATLPPHARVTPGALVGTAKIITYAVPEGALARAEAAGRGALRVHPVVHRDAALVMTVVPGQAESLGAKVLGVPLVVMLAWAMMAYPALLAAQRLARSRVLVTVIGAWLLATWDVFLDSQMVAEGHWEWA
ncbi:MAG: carotenoid biosynthesis protein, partial [Gemmobacter sp.]